MSAEILRLGNKTVELKPLAKELVPLVEQVAEQRKSAEDSARDLLMDTARGSFEGDPLHDRLRSAAKTIIEAPFARYSETFVGLMSNKNNREIASADEELKRLKGQIVLDLGNGRNPKLLQDFLTQYDIKAYVGVDSHNIFGQNHVVRRLTNFGDVMYLDKEGGDIVDGALVRGDMLRTTSSLPDQSVSVALCGIDNYVVNTQTPYGMRLVEEVARVLHPDGLIFGVQGPKVDGGILNELAKRPDMEEVGPDFPGFMFLRKQTVAGNT